MDRISVVGLGKLGTCLAATFAHRDFSVVGVDINPETVAQVNRGQAPVYEPGLDEMISANRSRLRATTDHEDAVLSSDLTFILVPTPSDSNGVLSLEYVKAAARSVGRALAHKDVYHVVVVESTVLPGSTEFGILPILEEESGKRCGQDFGLCHVPEFVALGTVLRDMLQPNYVVIGEHDQRAGALLESVYRRYFQNDPPIWRMNIVNAELVKIALNAYVTTKISFANTLAEVCERLPGGDVDAVTQAVGSDPRVGSKYFTGGLSFGGPCFPRDTRSFAVVLRGVGVEPLQIEATDTQNRTVAPRVVRYVESALSEYGDSGMVAVLGLAFKPGTVYLGDSPGMDIASALIRKGHDVIVYDPLALDAARGILGDQVQYVNTIEACLKQAEVLVFTTPDPEFRRLTLEDFRSVKRPITVIDCWRTLRFLANENPVRYLPLGMDTRQARQDVYRRLWGEG